MEKIVPLSPQGKEGTGRERKGSEGDRRRGEVKAGQTVLFSQNSNGSQPNLLLVFMWAYGDPFLFLVMISFWHFTFNS